MHTPHPSGEKNQVSKCIEFAELNLRENTLIFCTKSLIRMFTGDTSNEIHSPKVNMSNDIH